VAKRVERRKKNSSFLGLPKLFNDVRRMGFKVLRRWQQEQKEKKLRERERIV
jgi:hypothetical protein